MLQDHLDCSVLVDNNALYEILTNYPGIESSNYQDINRVIAQAASSLLECEMNTFQTNMIPYPKMHLLQSSFSPFISSDEAYKIDPTVHQITQEVILSKNSLLTHINPSGKCLTSTLVFRGNCDRKSII